MASVTIHIEPCPSTPLNLRLGVTYAPRAPTPHVGYVASEVSPGVFEVFGYDDDGGGAVVFRGNLGTAFVRLARCLRMDA